MSIRRRASNGDFDGVLKPSSATPRKLERPRVFEVAVDDQSLTQSVGQLAKKFAPRRLTALNHKTMVSPDIGVVAPSPLLRGTTSTSVVEKSGAIPLLFESVRVDGLTGDDVYDVYGGVLGVTLAHDAYMLWNKGGEGKLKKRQVGSIDINFAASLPKKGRYVLLMPPGTLGIHGWAHVKGQGHFYSRVAAKVNIHYSSFVDTEYSTDVVDVRTLRVHGDKTRSRDVTKHFSKSVKYPQQYVSVDGGGVLRLTHRLKLVCSANEDGEASVTVDWYGFPAVKSDDYDSVVFTPVSPETTTVPLVLKLPRDIACARIRAAGLTPRIVGADASYGWIVQQSPKAGKEVQVGSTVSITLRISPG